MNESDKRFCESLPLGTRVRALCNIWENPSCSAWPYLLYAETGDEGVVVHAQNGLFPTVRFDRTNEVTVVGPGEVKPFESKEEKE